MKKWDIYVQDVRKILRTMSGGFWGQPIVRSAVRRQSQRLPTLPKVEHCLYDFRMLPGIATGFFTKKHSVFQAKNYMFVVNEEPEEGGNVDIAISGNCSTNLRIYDSVSHENASRFVNMIGLACK